MKNETIINFEVCVSCFTFNEPLVSFAWTVARKKILAKKVFCVDGESILKLMFLDET